MSLRKSFLDSARGKILPLIVSLGCLGIAFGAVHSRGVVDAFTRMGAAGPAVAFLLILATLQLAVLRYAIILGGFGAIVPWTVVSRAVNLSALAALAPVSVVGQTVTRWVILRGSGVPTAVTVVSSLYERLLALGALAAFGLVALFALLARADVIPIPPAETQIGLNPTSPIALARTLAVVVIVAVAVGLTVLRRPLAAFLRRYLPGMQPGAVAMHIVISLGIHAATIAAFYTLTQTIAPQAPSFKVLGAIILVMLAGSFPISLGGWGFRELAAIFALREIGLSEAEALAVSIGIGALFGLGVAFFAWLSLFSWNAKSAGAQDVPARPRQWRSARVLAVAVPVLTAILVMFSVWIPLGRNLLNVNLADPIAAVGAVIFLAWWLPQIRRSSPYDRLYLSFFAGSCAVILVALLIGYARFGYSSWAFVNRGFGWGIVLAYFATGSLAVLTMRRVGLSVILRTLVVALGSVAVMDYLIHLSVGFGLLPPMTEWPDRMAGETGNPAAFAFHCLLVLGPGVILLTRARGREWVWFYAVVTAAVTALVASRVRAGYATFALVAAPTALLLALRYRVQTLVGLARPLVPVLLGALVLLAIGHLGFNLEPGPMLRPKSDGLRLGTILGGLDLFREHPLFGAGLGAFWHTRLSSGIEPLLVIHSVPIWILAEFGLLGAAFFGWFFLSCGGWFLKRLRKESALAAYVGLWSLGVFLVFGLAHDIFYQRLFWFMLGACLTAARPDWSLAPRRFGFRRSAPVPKAAPGGQEAFVARSLTGAAP